MWCIPIILVLFLQYHGWFPSSPRTAGLLRALFLNTVSISHFKASLTLQAVRRYLQGIPGLHPSLQTAQDTVNEPCCLLGAPQHRDFGHFHIISMKQAWPCSCFFKVSFEMKGETTVMSQEPLEHRLLSFTKDGFQAAEMYQGPRDKGKDFDSE